MQTIRWWLETGLAFALALLSVSSASASALEVRANHYVFHGNIVKGDAKAFFNVFQAHGNMPIVLHSPGGSVYEALKIAEFVRSQGGETRLTKSSTCASACVLIFAGGVIRSAEQGAKLGVHMGSGLLNESAVNLMRKVVREHGAEGAAYIASMFEQQAALVTLQQVDFLLKSGISIRLVKAASEVEHLDVRWLTRSEMQNFNLINTEAD